MTEAMVVTIGRESKNFLEAIRILNGSTKESTNKEVQTEDCVYY